MDNREIAALCVEEVWQAKQAAELTPVKFTKRSAAEIVESVLNRVGFSLSSDPAAPKVKRTKADLDALFDALVAVQKGNSRHMTKHERSGVAESRKQIMDASPDVTPAEIAKRAKLYKSKWPTWPLTAMSLTKRWSQLGPGDPTLAERTDIYQEPKTDWKPVALRVSGLSSFPESWNNWADVPADWRSRIIAAI
jgi:hypothetical protein